MKVRFIKSPTGKYHLAYSANQEAVIKDKDLCLQMIADGTAVEVKAVKKKVSN